MGPTTEWKYVRKETETVMGVIRSSESSAMAGELICVSEDMNELVFHPDAIQNNISMLAKRPISVFDNNCYVVEFSCGKKADKNCC